MPAVNRQQLENALKIDQAAELIESFRKDTETYPNDTFLARQGICKLIEEEYVPLVRVAEFVDGRTVRLSPNAHQGPDGEIGFSDRADWSVQITCSHESLERALFRNELSRVGAVTRQISTAEVDARFERILSAIEAKELNYHEGTDTLIVLDSPANVRYLSELKPRVAEAIYQRHSKYQRVFVVYGEDVRQAK